MSTNMSAKAVLSSKGQLVIPKSLRKRMGLHFGSEFILELTNKNSLELLPIKQDVSKFFGMGKSKINQQLMSVDDIDKAISKAVIKNDRH
jgi:AbrB family looped-hinge helix DNA binding protein